MGVTVNGDSIIISDATIELVNALNVETGVAYIIITPAGGVGQLPFLAVGDPGQPSLFPDITLEQVPAGDPLPTPNPVSTLVDPGGAGLPAKYSLKFYLNKGDTGLTGSPSISGSSDLAASPALGAETDKFGIIYRSSDSMFVPTAQKVGNIYAPGSVIGATAYDNTNPRLLATITVAAQPFDWWPLVWAQCLVTGSADTRVDLVARLDDPASGAQVGYSKGMAGATPPVNVMIPAPPADQVLPGSYGKVSAGNAATIYLRAEQKASSSNPWSTAASPDTTFCVGLMALL